MREGHLDRKDWRQPADWVMFLVNREAGMSWVRARLAYRAVRLGGEAATWPNPEGPLSDQVLTAP